MVGEVSFVTGPIGSSVQIHNWAGFDGDGSLFSVFLTTRREME